MGGVPKQRLQRRDTVPLQVGAWGDKRTELPSYTTDLNEMRKAWLKLTCNDNRDMDDTTAYYIYLHEIVRDDINPKYSIKDAWVKDNVINATALQRAKALAKALKLNNGRTN